MANNAELAKIGLDVVNGRYVLKSTLFLVAALAFCLGGFMGFTISNMGDPGNTRAVNSAQAPSGNTGASQADHEAQQFKLEEAARKNPNEPAVWTQLGNFYFDHQEAQKAVQAYEKSLALQPEAPDVIVDAGIMYRDLKQYNKAVEYFDRAIAIDPKHQNARFNKGIVLYNDLNKKAEGVAAWKELLRIQPDTKVSGGVSLEEFIKEHPAN